MPSINKFPNKINANFDFSFAVALDGLYAITISARCHSREQAGTSNGEDLRVEIDGRQFRELPPLDKPQYYNIPPAWNGAELMGLKKITVFIIRLSAGDHLLNFIPRGSATIEREPEIKFLGAMENFEFNLAQKAENGDRRPWYTFVLVDIPLKSVSAEVSVEWHWWDGDDVKLVIDNQIQQNLGSRFHRNWLWSAGFRQLFDAKREQKTIVVNLQRGIHYVEFWADRTPLLSSVRLDLGANEVKRSPTREDPLWTGNFNDDSEQIILARLIFGEARSEPAEAKEWIGWTIINRTTAKSWWPNTVHGVILQKDQYDPFKADDDNFKKIIDPLIKGVDVLTKDSWYESYQIAEGIILGKKSSPTSATHFHGVGVSREWFEKNVVPQGKFIKKIGNTYFYWSPN